MYPNLYYAFKDLFGIEFTPLRFINSFGFFVVIAFIVAASLLTAELRRKSKAGLLVPTEETLTVGQPASLTDLALNFLLGFAVGYKIIALFFLGPEASADPQAYIFSGAGSLPAGLATGAVFAFLKWQEKNKTRLAQPETRKVRVWPQDRVGEITMLALVFGLLGAKMFDIFENWSDFLTRPMAYILSGGGLTFYGGLICATLAIIIFARKHHIPLRHLADSLAPALMLAYAIGRIGCQVAGDGDWGIENTSPNPVGFLPNWMWSYNYPHNVNEVGVPIPGCDGRYCAQLPVGHYPTPFYETVACTLLFGVLWAVRKKIRPYGALFALYLVLNGLERFFIEKIRVNNKMNLLGFHPTQAEVIATALMIIGILLWLFLRRRSATVASS